jgi:hypothetical protein
MEVPFISRKIESLQPLSADDGMTTNTGMGPRFYANWASRNAFMMSSYRFQNTWKIPNRVVCGNLRVTSALTSGIILAPGKYGESADAERHKIYAERPKGQRMNKTQTAGVDLAEIPMRKVSLHHAQCALAESPVIRRHPSPVNVDPSIDSGNYQNGNQHRGAHAPILACPRGRYLAVASVQQDSHFDAQTSFRRLRRSLHHLALHLSSSAASRRRADCSKFGCFVHHLRNARGFLSRTSSRHRPPPFQIAPCNWPLTRDIITQVTCVKGQCHVV